MTRSPDPFLDATAQAQLIRTGEVAPDQFIELAIERIRRFNPALNAVIHERFDAARREAKAAGGPFRGVPYLLKDLTYSKDDPHCAGIAGVKRAGYRANHDAYLVESLRKAGFVLVGLANTPELGLTATTEPVAFGPTRNPWNLDYSTGGSSGGSAAAVAAALVPVAHGSDGGGSVRMPSSQCGVLGLKPTRGRISTGPLIRDSDDVSGMSHEGLHARTVRDIAAMLDIVGGSHPGSAYRAPPPSRPYIQEVGADPGKLRIGVLTTDPTGSITIDPECVRATRATAEALAKLGHHVEDSYPKVLDKGSWPQEFMPCIAVVVKRELDYYGRLIGRQLTEDDVEFSTWNYAQMGSQVSAMDYAAGVDSIRVQAREMERWWEQGWDLLLTPTLPVLPPRIGEIQPTRENPFSTLAMHISHFTVPFNVSGQPALSLPLHQSNSGFPVGVQLAAAYGRDDLLLRAAAQLEQAMPWSSRRPPLAV